MTSRNAAKPPCFSSQPGSAHWVCSASAGGGKRTQSPEHITNGNIGGPPQGGLFAALHFGRDWPFASFRGSAAIGRFRGESGHRLRLNLFQITRGARLMDERSALVAGARSSALWGHSACPTAAAEYDLDSVPGATAILHETFAHDRNFVGYSKAWRGGA